MDGLFSGGCYYSFYDFRNDSLVRRPYGMRLVTDSLYMPCVNDRRAKAADELVDGIWAYSDTAGRLYIRVLGNRFVALREKDDGFCFYLPRAPARGQTLGWVVRLFSSA